MKKKYVRYLLGSLIMACFLDISVCAKEVKICKESELVGISSEDEGGVRSEYFTCDGEYVGFLNTNIGQNEIKKVKKNTLVLVMEDHKNVIYRFDTPIQKIAEYPAKTGVMLGETGYITGDYEKQEISLYALDGTYIITIPAYITAWMEPDEYSYMQNVKLECTPSGYYLGYLEPLVDETADYKYHIKGIRFDGMVMNEVLSGTAYHEWDEWQLPEFHAVGDYVLVEGNAYDLQGQCVLENVFCTYEPSERFDYNVKASGMIQRDVWIDGQENYVLYNQNLEEEERSLMPEELKTVLDEVAEYPGQKQPYWDGITLSNAYSDKLNGESCSGFIGYCGPSYSPVYIMKDNVEGWIPYARTEDGAYVYLNGETRFLPLSETEELTGINDYLYITNENEDGWFQQIHRLDNGEVILKEESSFLCLEQNFITGYHGWEDGFYYNIIDIDRDTYEISEDMVSGLLSPWSDDCLVVRRSIYKGITDRNGNWIVKTIIGGLD